MVPRLTALMILVALTLVSAAEAAGTVEVFINNKKFKGGVSGPASDLMLEAEPYFKLAGGDFAFNAEDGTATLDGQTITVSLVGGVPYVRAKEMVSLVGGRYNHNAALGSVDIYAFDPVEAARKAWARIIAAPRMNSQDDLAIMNTLTRGILTKDLGMDLEFPVEVVLVTEAEMKALTHSDDYASYTSFNYRPGGTGIANANVAISQGLPPLLAMSFLGRSYGSLWAYRLGMIESHQEQVRGFGLWVGHYVLQQMGLNMPPGQWGTDASAEARQEFVKLLDLQQTGGGAGVVTWFKNLAGKR